MATLEAETGRVSFQVYRSPRALAIAAGQTTYSGGKTCPKGHQGLRFTASGICCVCAAVYAKARYDTGYRTKAEIRSAANLKFARSEKGLAAKHRWKEKDRKWAWAVSVNGAARRRSKEYGVPYDLTNEYIRGIIPTHCPALGCELDFAPKEGFGVWNSPSLDRTIAAYGYVRGNVSVISRRANAIKNDASGEEVLAVALWLATLV